MLKVELAVDARIFGQQPLELAAPAAAAVGIRGLELAESRALLNHESLDRFLRGFSMRLAGFRVPAESADAVLRPILPALQKMGSNRIFIASSGPMKAEEAAELCKAVSRQCLPMGIRPVLCGASLGLEQCQRFCELVAPEQGGLGADTGELAMRSIDAETFVEKFSSRIEYVRLRDVDESGRTAQLGRGCSAVEKFVEGLREASYVGWLCLQPPGLEALPAAREFLQTRLRI